MNKELEDCLSSNKIRKFPRAKELVSKESIKLKPTMTPPRTASSAKVLNGAPSNHITRCFIPAGPFSICKAIGREVITV